MEVRAWRVRANGRSREAALRASLNAPAKDEHVKQVVAVLELMRSSLSIALTAVVRRSIDATLMPAGA